MIKKERQKKFLTIFHFISRKKPIKVISNLKAH
jgi:hypothetical protein